MWSHLLNLMKLLYGMHGYVQKNVEQKLVDFGKSKRFHDSIYQNLWELSLVILSVKEHDFELPWLWEQLYFDCICWLVLVAIISCVYPIEYFFESVEK